MNNKTIASITLNVALTLILMATILAFSGKARFDEARLSELRRELREQQTDNENLQYQLKQCKILYRGM